MSARGNGGDVDVDGPPDTKRFRIDVNTQVGLDAPSVSTTCTVATPVAGEQAAQDGQSPAAPSSASYRSSNSSVISSSESPIKEEDVDAAELQHENEPTEIIRNTTPMVNNTEIFEMLNKTFGGVFNCDLGEMIRPSALMNPPSPPTPVPHSGIPGALAVAQSPAAQLFANDDWSWHRNPAASIRSGGTNKQTPVWKYFVYNKVENLSRCIVGDCTYMLKGPHTSTLACHLKKHTKEYSEFQKLKADYSRTKLEQQPKVPDGGPFQSTSPHRQTVSPVSTTSNTNTTASLTGATMDLSMKPKPKAKEPSKINEMLLNGLPSSPVAPPTPMSTMPSFVTNMMLQMNPLQMMLAMPGAAAAAAAASTSNSTSSGGLQALQQAGLSLAANGQIIQSKKWRNDEKKQKELVAKLSLALATSHVNIEVLQNPLWRELFELAQPKFSLPTEQQYSQIVGGTWQKLQQNLKSIIGGMKKLNLMVDVTKITTDISRLTVSAAITAGAGNSYETQTILLAFRNLPQSDNSAEDVANAFERVLEDYNISEDSINRVVCSGFAGFVGDDTDNDTGNILAKQMDSFSSKAATCFNVWLETSQTMETLKKNIYQMLLSYLTVPTAMALASQMVKGKFELPVTETFQVIVENLVAHREIYQMNLDGLATISDREWQKVTGIHHLLGIFKPLMGYTTDMTTVDTVIPTIFQIRNALEKDIYQLGDIGTDLLASLKTTVAPIINANHEDFDPTYIQATALNPQLAVTLSQDQMSLARNLIEKEVAKRLRKTKSQNEKKLAMGVDSLLANVMKKADSGDNDNALALYGDLFHSIKGRGGQESNENIVGQYFDEISSSNSVESIFTPMLRTFGNPMQAPLAYWKTCSVRCAELSELASEIVSIPIFTLTAERVLSFSSPSALNTNLILTNLDSADQFEKQLLMRFNRQILAKLFN
uniref:HAT C-terminal dimerisation domain-containing protein n=1 Tax=Caenorhabditis japonica TaxID=281687 RepID=A0A8R1I2A9_CAEJA